ncbi:hypothetical protein HPP92_010934 [Vanilla planifolia]|uniref:Uncharacterized protein n=1 Tax=Vanilla planifolia TaxID=51239 RepID=A0A835R7G6_VANPL|nr:hypothetical protein HPP92_010934 [Vanilla planifolia]
MGFSNRMHLSSFESYSGCGKQIVVHSGFQNKCENLLSNLITRMMTYAYNAKTIQRKASNCTEKWSELLSRDLKHCSFLGVIEVSKGTCKVNNKTQPSHETSKATQEELIEKSPSFVLGTPRDAMLAQDKASLHGQPYRE